MCKSWEKEDQNIQKKYSTSFLSTVPASISPKTIIGAAISPRLNCSVVWVNLYVGLKALDMICRAILLLASMSAVRVEFVQKARDSAKTVALNMWFEPK